MGGDKIVEPDAMAKIGLYVGSGGAQGEAHAKSTAKNTEKTASGVTELVALAKRGRKGRATFGGG